jgi:hypothetical protein
VKPELNGGKKMNKAQADPDPALLMYAALKEALEVMGSWDEDGDPAWAYRAREAIKAFEKEGD